ncbi:pseudouridine-5'-phosphate glycosidase [Lichenihabitans sp. Uapishka_5]|uniref:pseudouridine-5'-phosphate glycosidase n=1 Tax=Lichenihabitans sp. Uapishka_5 TaxID=3037302 RepID=UPI0029E80DB3|nr:pseudouridine-5'-phosphate glycosidase [Lichenihabitans sp. Uapishka_5]MDX7953797.1 pseudouridine-5'-phosphate glycosidase [Lichenihabitans sp. Uapishka_5]
MQLNSFLTVGAEVRDALGAGKPVVALESTIITHGMPYPANLETARAVEAVVRQNGATPATIAVLDGKLVAGMDDATLQRLATATGVVKASRRDLAAVLSTGGSAGTTVAATMIVAKLAGIAIFATGGIGGVHRGAEATFDISADLLELAQTPVTVVCAGAKSILDLPKTLEVLETHGVPVLGYGSDEFPAFFSRTSGHTVDHRFDTPEALARVIGTQRALGLGTGILVTNPIPLADAIDSATIDPHIAAAVAEAETQGIGRKELTPFLLQRILDLTGGRSLEANIALVKNNATLAARMAVALAAL